MTVYVDEAVIPFRGDLYAHMLASDLDELHRLAARIGLRRSWFQNHGTFPHYDVSSGKRYQAIAAGAVPIGMGEIPDDVLCKQRDGTYITRGERQARAAARRAAREAAS